MTPRLIISLSPAEPATSACLPDGREVTEDSAVREALEDCNASGDCQPACEYVRDEIGVDWRIVARNPVTGEYENRAATAAEKQATAEAIYFESDSDFSDESLAETYLIWDAARELESCD